MSSSKIKISKYREDHNYICELREFTRKELLVCALYQEWVRIRYTKPTPLIAYIISSLILVTATFSLLISIEEGMLQWIIGLVNLLTILLVCYILWMNRKSEASEIDKLNAMRDAIEEFSKTQ